MVVKHAQREQHAAGSGSHAAGVASTLLMHAPQTARQLWEAVVSIMSFIFSYAGVPQRCCRSGSRPLQ